MKVIPTRRRIPIVTELLELREMTQTPLGFCERMVREYGDVCHVPLPGVHNYMIHDASLLREVFVNQASKFRKSRLYKAMQKVIGLGLLTSDGDYHLQQRRLVAPVFHRQRIAEYAETMVRCTLEEMEHWKEGETLNMQDAMSAITMRVITQTMFSSRVAREELSTIADLVNTLLEEAASVFQNPFTLLCFEIDLMIPSVKRVHEMTKQVDCYLVDIITSYRQTADSSGTDLLSLLMQTRDEESGAALSDKQIRDEIITMFMAGHETTATALHWTWYLMGANPNDYQKVQNEIRVSIESRVPNADDFGSLVFTKNVFKESLRLYPPVWTIAREPMQDIEIDGYAFPKGSVLCTITPIMHHKPEYFHKPDEFLPDRWDLPDTANLPRFVYFPFGGGNRICIGEGFAWMEAMMILATILSRAHFEPIGSTIPQLRPLFTLRAKDPVHMTFRRR